MENNLSILENTELKIKSVELVDIINSFREVEGNRTVLRHDTFMTKIKKEIETLESFGLVNLQNFMEVDYIDSKGRKYPCYELNRNSMLQMLNSESAIVRYKTIEYINKLENDINNKQLLVESNKLALAHKEIEELKTSLNNTLQDFNLSIDEAKKQFKLSHRRKLNYNKIIRMLSDNRDEAEDIKEWTFATLNISKWEDTCVSDHDKIIEAIKTGAKLLAINKIEQPSLF